MKMMLPIRRLLSSASAKQSLSLTDAGSSGGKAAKIAIGFVVLLGAGYGVGRWRRDYLDKIPVPYREVSSADLDPQGIVTEKVFFDVSVNNKPPKRIIFGLYGRDYPALVKNFGDLCDGIAHYHCDTKSSYDYHNTSLHRVIPGLLCQGGADMSRTPTTVAAQHLLTEYASASASAAAAAAGSAAAVEPMQTTSSAASMSEMKATASTPATAPATSDKFVVDANGVKTLAPTVSVGNLPEIVADIFTTARSPTGASPSKYKHCKFGVLSTSASEKAIATDPNVVGNDFVITFKEAPWMDRLTSSTTYTVIGQVMYNGGEVLQEIESFGSTTGQPRTHKIINSEGKEVSQPTVITITQCGRLPAMSKALDPQADEILDVNGKNINQIIN